MVTKITCSECGYTLQDSEGNYDLGKGVVLCPKCYKKQEIYYKHFNNSD